MNEKHQAFVTEYVKSGNATKAAIAAGFAPRSAPATGARLLLQEDIAGEITARQLEAVQGREQDLTTDRQSLLREVEEAREIAKKSGNASAMIACTQAKMRLFGFDLENQEASEARFKVAVEVAARRIAGEELARAAESLGLPRAASPAMIVGALSERPLPTPEAYRLMRAAAMEAANA